MFGRFLFCIWWRFLIFWMFCLLLRICFLFGVVIIIVFGVMMGGGGIGELDLKSGWMWDLFWVECCVKVVCCVWDILFGVGFNVWFCFLVWEGGFKRFNGVLGFGFWLVVGLVGIVLRKWFSGGEDDVKMVCWFCGLIVDVFYELNFFFVVFVCLWNDGRFNEVGWCFCWDSKWVLEEMGWIMFDSEFWKEFIVFVVECLVLDLGGVFLNDVLLWVFLEIRFGLVLW